MAFQINNRYRSFYDTSPSITWFLRCFFAVFALILIVIIQKSSYPNSELAQVIQMRYKLSDLQTKNSELSTKIESTSKEVTYWEKSQYASLHFREQKLIQKSFPKSPVPLKEEVYNFTEK